MRRRLSVLFLCLCTACLITSFFVIRYTGGLINSKNDGLERVQRNDILKNAQGCLEGEQEKPLLDSLKEYQASLVLYSADGTILYDNNSKSRIDQKEDVNQAIEEAGQPEQVFIVNYRKGQSNRIAVAILTKNNPDAGNRTLSHKISAAVWVLYGTFIFILAVIFLVIYLNVLRPFHRLESFASEVAKGNLDVPVIYPKHNIFGAFSWAFDMMRNELKRSKESREEAERAKKELVAALSHDIRTPISSIKAYAECLDGLPDKNSDRSERYIRVISQKADELAKLSEDMFLHAISDLEKLEVTPKVCQSRELFNNILEPMILQYDNRIVIPAAIPDVRIYTDQARLAQVIENILMPPSMRREVKSG